MRLNEVAIWSGRLSAFAIDAHQLFGSIESAPSRRITLGESYSRLEGLSLRQDDLFRQALRCVENQLYRAAHVMAWASFIDCLQQMVSSDDFARLNAARPSWNVTSLEQMAESFTEHALIEAMLKMSIINKAESKAFLGMLSKRNECAHPGAYFPSYNETLGYITELFSRLDKLNKRYIGLRL